MNKIGVVAKLNDKYWGIIHEDGHSTSYGWTTIDKASVSDIKYCKKPSDMTYEGSPYTSELEKSTLVRLEKTIIFNEYEL